MRVARFINCFNGGGIMSDIDIRLIENWKELATVEESETHKLEIEEYCGWVIDKATGKHETYLSTHTFYGQCFEYSTKILQECGFNVQIKNWDETTTNKTSS